MLTTIKLVVFDLAGTTVKDDNNVPEALQKAFEPEGIAIDLEDAVGVMGIPKPVAIAQLLKRYMEESSISETLINKIHDAFLMEMISFYQTSPTVEEKKGVSYTFRNLKENNIKIALDTGFDRTITDVLIDRLGWLREGLIDAIVTSDEVLHGRPQPDMIFKAMELTGIKRPEEVAKVGDTTYDLMEGNSAGCKYVIGVTTGAFKEETLRTVKHSHLIKELPEILEILSVPHKLIIDFKI